MRAAVPSAPASSPKSWIVCTLRLDGSAECSAVLHLRGSVRRHGIPCEERQATQLKKSDYQYYDYLIGMDEKNMRNMEKITGQKAGDKMFMLLDLTGEHRSVADPWYSRDFQATYRDVVKGCIALLDRLQQQNG